MLNVPFRVPLTGREIATQPSDSAPLQRARHSVFQVIHYLLKVIQSTVDLLELLIDIFESTSSNRHCRIDIVDLPELSTESQIPQQNENEADDHSHHKE
jgi:hypothetical protein